MSPSKQSVFVPDTPEASLKREKFRFNAVIEKYIALAHGLPPSPNISSQLQRDRPPTTPLEKQRTSTGKTTKKSKAVAQPLRQSLNNVPHTPSLSIEEEIVQEVEESLLKRKEELGLPADYVCKEVMKYNPKCYGHHSARKNTTHNSPTPPKRNKESSRYLKKSDGKMLEDATHSQKLVSQSQTKTLKQKTEEVNELDTDVILGSPELKMKKVTKTSEDSSKKLEVIKSKSPNQRAKERRKYLNIDAKQISGDKTKTPRKNTRGKKSSDERERKNQSIKTKSIGKATAGNTEKEGNAAMACDLKLADKGKPLKEERCSKLLDAMKKAAFVELSNGAQIVDMVQEQNHIFCLFDNLDILHLNISQENEEASQTVRNNAGTSRTSTSSEHQNGRMPTNENRKEIEKEQTVRREIGTTASGQQSVIECANKKRIKAKSEQVVRSHPAKEKISESELQIANKHTLKQKTVTAQEKQKTRLPVNKYEPPVEPQESKKHTVTETTGIPTVTSITAAAQQIVKIKKITVPVKQISKTKAIQDEQTNGIHNNLQEKADTAQQSSRTSNNKIKEKKKQQTVLPQDIYHIGKTKDNQNPKTHPSESENVAHRKPHSTVSCIKEKRDTQQEQQVRKQGTMKKTKVHQSASEVHKKVPKKRKIGVMAKGSDSAKVLESVPISPKSCDIPNTGMEISDALSPRNASHSSADSSDQLTGNGLSKKRKFDYLRFLGSDDEDSDWSTISHEDENDSFEELNVKKKKKKGSELFNKKTSKRPNKSSQKADDDDEDIIILKSFWPPPANNENNSNIASTANENHIQTSKSSQKEPSPLKNLMTKRTLERHQKNSFSERAAKRQVARYLQRKMEVTATADQSTEEELRFHDTWSLLCPPPVQQSFSYLTSRTRMTPQGSQLRVCLLSICAVLVLVSYFEFSFNCCVHLT
ncbi:hypothetical protein E2C01_008218 [Portunus trituberculatus]|uniref:Uncharacterized protein n=1 Tax=Portunus trituberculatus TaxID=210409 RepID=A0A5B7D474_PORTR|nr:hypothetical protein [Portunus trituberculatus]